MSKLHQYKFSFFWLFIFLSIFHSYPRFFYGLDVLRLYKKNIVCFFVSFPLLLLLLLFLFLPVWHLFFNWLALVPQFLL